MTQPQVLICHPKDIEPDELNQLVSQVHEAGHFNGAALVTARDSFLAFEQKHGKPVNWRRWFDEITGLLPGFSSTPRFAAFVVGPTAMIGKATKDIVGEALRKGRPVYRLKDASLVRVTKVVVLDPENFKHGWVIA